MTDNREDFLAAMDEAVRKGGGIVAFARRMGVAHQAVYHWRKQGFAPVKRAIEIEAAFGIDRDRLMEPSLAQALSTPRAGE